VQLTHHHLGLYREHRTGRFVTVTEASPADERTPQGRVRYLDDRGEEHVTTVEEFFAAGRVAYCGGTVTRVDTSGALRLVDEPAEDV
jgi:hypothetical protein